MQVSGSADKTAIIWQAHEPGNPKGIATPSAVDAKWLEACTLSGEPATLSFDARFPVRSGLAPFTDRPRIIQGFHGREVFSVDWSHHDKGWIATGCGDNYIRVFSEVNCGCWRPCDFILDAAHRVFSHTPLKGTKYWERRREPFV
jgi:WD40 repeat protein